MDLISLFFVKNVLIRCKIDLQLRHSVAIVRNTKLSENLDMFKSIYETVITHQYARRTLKSLDSDTVPSIDYRVSFLVYITSFSFKESVDEIKNLISCKNVFKTRKLQDMNLDLNKFCILMHYFEPYKCQHFI